MTWLPVVMFFLCAPISVAIFGRDNIGAPIVTTVVATIVAIVITSIWRKRHARSVR